MYVQVNQGRRRGNYGFAIDTLNVHVSSFLAPIRVVQVALICVVALYTVVLMFVMYYNYKFIDLKCNLISINLIAFN
jgi:hypothetical protein